MPVIVLVRSLLVLASAALAACATLPPGLKERPEASHASTAGAPEPSSGGGAAASPCGKLPFFSVYARERAVKLSSAELVELELPIDLHAKDCGAPDCFGHELSLKLELRAAAGACRIVRASAQNRPFNHCGVHPSQIEPAFSSTFQVSGNPDLSKPDLERIELHDASRRNALLLLRDIYFFYEGVLTPGTLKPELEPDQASGCCYGYTGSHALRWRSNGST